MSSEKNDLGDWEVKPGWDQLDLELYPNPEIKKLLEDEDVNSDDSSEECTAEIERAAIQVADGIFAAENVVSILRDQIAEVAEVEASSEIENLKSEITKIENEISETENILDSGITDWLAKKELEDEIAENKKILIKKKTELEKLEADIDGAAV